MNPARARATGPAMLRAAWCLCFLLATTAAPAGGPLPQTDCPRRDTPAVGKPRLHSSAAALDEKLKRLNSLEDRALRILE